MKKIDLVVSNGDFLPFHYKEIWFKYCFMTGIELWQIIGKTKYKELILREFRDGEKLFRVLNNLGVPVITVLGNNDYQRADDVMDGQKNNWEWDKKMEIIIKKFIKKYKNIKLVDYSAAEYKGLIFIGMRGSSFPGFVKSKAFKRSRNKLVKLFMKYSNENKAGEVVFLSHNVPYNTKLDIIKDKNSKPVVFGKHYGSKLFRRMIDKFQPTVAIGGHIHESFGKQRLGKTLVLNPGAANDGRAMILDTDKRMRVKFIK
jgi:Icc-related predicted phosphoesterase